MSADGAVNCSDFWAWPPNIFNPDCYGITAAKLFGTDAQKAAAYGATSPDVVYVPIAAPPAVSAPTGDELILPPADGQSASGVIDRVLAREKAAWNAQNADTMNSTAANIAAAGKLPSANTGTALLLIGAAVFIGVLVLEKR